VTGPDPVRAFMPLFEALNWAAAIDFRLQRDWPGQPSEKGRWSDAFDAGKTLRGLRFARNRVHHQWADAIARAADHAPRRRRVIVPARGWSGTGLWTWRRTLPPESPVTKTRGAVRPTENVLQGYPCATRLRNFTPCSRRFPIRSSQAAPVSRAGEGKRKRYGRSTGAVRWLRRWRLRRWWRRRRNGAWLGGRRGLRRERLGLRTGCQRPGSHHGPARLAAEGFAGGGPTMIQTGTQSPIVNTLRRRCRT
jgi:hypothetical protein